METKIEHFMDSDLTHCPITLEILRHPILASDGRHYELRDLHEWLIDLNQNISPTNRQTLTSVTYDRHLKQTLDALDLPDRYEDYDEKNYLNTLLTTINPTHLSQIPCQTKSIALFNGCFIALLACSSVEQFHSAFLISALVGLSDYAMRCSTNNRHSLFSIRERAGALYRTITAPDFYMP